MLLLAYSQYIEKGGDGEIDRGSEQLAAFREEWPDGAEVTEENLNRAIALGLDIEWFATIFLSDPAMEACRKALARSGNLRNGVPYPEGSPEDVAFQKALAPELCKAWQSME